MSQVILNTNPCSCQNEHEEWGYCCRCSLARDTLEAMTEHLHEALDLVVTSDWPLVYAHLTFPSGSGCEWTFSYHTQMKILPMSGAFNAIATNELDANK